MSDVFHKHNPSMRAIVFAQNLFRKLASKGIEVYLLTGNHDTNDVKADISAARVLHDPARKIYSHAEPYVHYELTDGVHLHMVSHHMYEDQFDTMKQVKPLNNEVNIFATHGSVIDPILKMKLHTEQSPREIVIPDTLLEGEDWTYRLLGHIHERGFVGSKDGSKDELNLKTYYNGSLIRRGFSDKPCVLGRGWTKWYVHDNGDMIPEFHTVAQRPQIDFDIIDGSQFSASEISDQIIDNLRKTQTNGNVLDVNIAPMLRQRISNIDMAKYSAIDFSNINKNSEHALIWDIKKISSDEVDNSGEEVELDGEAAETGDVVKLYDDFLKNSENFSKISHDIQNTVQIQSRRFIENGQEVVLNKE